MNSKEIKSKIEDLKNTIKELKEIINHHKKTLLAHAMENELKRKNEELLKLEAKLKQK